VKSARVSGTEGYADEAKTLFDRYESVAGADAHRAVRHLIPTAPGKVLDIGAGTGRDAAWFASMGHRVVAVEPTEEMRIPAMALHPSPHIEWLDDCLPDLAVLRERGECFDLVMLSAVWMHLDAGQRQRAMPNLATLVVSGGRVIMKVRHGPVPAGRRMFEIADEEVTALAGKHGLHPILVLRAESASEPNRSDGISWSNFVFVKGDPPA
jgi:SAM-dependent methyltransferase